MALELGTILRVKVDPNGQYFFLSERAFLRQEREQFIETYRFIECLEDDDGVVTGINAAGNRERIN